MTNSEGSRASQRRMVEGESSNARETRLKMQADLEKMNQRMEGSDAEEDLGIFEDVELVLKNMQLGKFFSHRMESYKELTCEFLASMKHHEFVSSIELSWTKGGGT
ncbi:unnamed protein product [Microthlaspi erraticum]|uniref:Arabidopsis retrotransposon Orf1 C-terminal domain-containing protein n=1 Tax=Microthlaspi erraticum TaxID=1685480 RepID=A0A6D2K4U0_9BRAS|nr:unnamed protein product [Microthlaspi erraticum]